jgi:hypothetical protein
LDVTAEGALLTRSGAPSRRRLAVGPLTKGANWEMTAVPELRTRYRDLAHILARRLARIGLADGQFFHADVYPTGDTAFWSTASERRTLPIKLA